MANINNLCVGKNIMKTIDHDLLTFPILPHDFILPQSPYLVRIGSNVVPTFIGKTYYIGI